MHPNVVTIFGAGEEGGRTFLAMELVEGQTFRLSSPYAPVTRRLAWLLDVARALGAVHRAGFVHRDVKPDNVMVTSGGAKLLDFGVARAPLVPTDGPPGLGQTSTGQIIGTPRYIAPEQWRAGSVDGRTDQFAWGVMAYEALAGRHPDEASPGFGRVADWRAPATPLHALVPELPFGVSALVGRALAVFPDQRFPTMEALATELEVILANATGVAQASGLVAPSQAPTSAESAASAPGALASPSPTRVEGVARAEPTARAPNRAAVFAVAMLAVPLIAIAGVGVTLFLRGRVEPTSSAAPPAPAAPSVVAPPVTAAPTAGPEAGAVAAPVDAPAERPALPAKPAPPAPSASTAAKPSSCQRYKSATVDAARMNTAPGPARAAWERALAAPLLACVRAAPERFCRGKQLTLGVEIQELEPSKRLAGFVGTITPETGFTQSDDELNACVARALPTGSPRPEGSPRIGGWMVLRLSL